jgi:hypothetical protein
VENAAFVSAYVKLLDMAMIIQMRQKSSDIVFRKEVVMTQVF